MAFPISFVTGAAIGAVTTYIMKDDSARAWTVEKGKQLKDKADSMVESMKEKRAAKKAEDAAKDAIDNAEDAMHNAKEAVA